jgi:hypothetical protein
MKTAFLLLTSSLVIGASGAFAQGNTDACHNQYASCTERCSTRPQAVQESCSSTCESTTQGRRKAEKEKEVTPAQSDAGRGAAQAALWLHFPKP